MVLKFNQLIPVSHKNPMHCFFIAQEATPFLLLIPSPTQGNYTLAIKDMVDFMVCCKQANILGDATKMKSSTLVLFPLA